MWVMQIPNMIRYFLSIHVELVLKFFKYFESFGVWSLGIGFWRFNIS